MIMMIRMIIANPGVQVHKSCIRGLCLDPVNYNLDDHDHDHYDHDDEIQVMWGQGQLPPGSVPMWGPGMPGETITFIWSFTGRLINYLDL